MAEVIQSANQSGRLKSSPSSVVPQSGLKTPLPPTVGDPQGGGGIQHEIGYFTTCPSGSPLKSLALSKSPPKREVDEPWLHPANLRRLSVAQCSLQIDPENCGICESLYKSPRNRPSTNHHRTADESVGVPRGCTPSKFRSQ